MSTDPSKKNLFNKKIENYSSDSEDSYSDSKDCLVYSLPCTKVTFTQEDRKKMKPIPEGGVHNASNDLMRIE